jgi:sugar phosphate isomerase/epimerase
MRIAISNIAWDPPEDEAVASILNRFNVDAIDVAPGKYFPDPAVTTDAQIAKVKDWWSGRGIEITGMQALLFGTSGLNVFGSDESQSAMLKHLGHVCRIAAGLSAPRLVFGSPKNRDRSGKSDEETRAIAVSFFRRLGDIAHASGVTICLEPNPTHYGANFMTTAQETAEVVRAVGHSSIKMQLDTGALTINNENVVDVLDDSLELIGHVHISEPDLVPVGDGKTDHRVMSSALGTSLPSHLITIEMVATRNEPHLSSIERALQTVTSHYRPD